MGISVNDVIVDESATFVRFTITLSEANTSTVTVNYATSGVTAGSNDFTTVSGTLTFAPGQLAQTVDVPLLSDTFVEDLETFRFTLSSPSNSTIDRAVGLGQIVDNDTLVGTPRLSVRDVVVDEKAGTATFIVSLDELHGHASSQSITVDYATAGGTATSGSDFAATSGTLTFSPGQTVKAVTVAITDDTVAEGLERFTLNLSNAINATIIDSQGIAEIGLNDGAAVGQPRISVADRIVGETESYVDVVVSLSGPGTSPVAVNYTSSSGSAGTNDFSALSGTLNFAIGETTKVVRVSLFDDSADEDLEHFRFNLSNPTNATIADGGSAMISIIDNEAIVGTPAIFLHDVVVDEKAGTATFAVTLGGPLGGSSNSIVSVDFSTADDTALAGSDYVARSGSLTFAPGESVKTVTIDIADDAIAEGRERFNLNLTNAVNASIADAQGVAEIAANDASPIVQPRITVGDRFVSEHDGYLDVTVLLNAPGQSNVSVNYTTASVSASGNDFDSVAGTLNFAPGETAKVVRIELSEDSGREGFEYFRFNLSSPTNATLGDNGSAVIYIADNDTVVDTPLLFVRDAVIDERAGTVAFVVLLGNQTGQSSTSTVSVNYTTFSDTATAGSDFIAKSGTLVFAPGESAKTIVVDIIDDATAEGLERFGLTLSNAINATITDSQAIAEIWANDSVAVAQPRISVSDRFVGEDDGFVDMVVSLSAPGQTAVAVSYATASVTAGSNDFAGISGTLSFAAGETVKVLRVQLYTDMGNEGLEHFRFNLSSPVNATLANNGYATIYIGDNDVVSETPQLYVRDVVVDEKAGTATFAVLLDHNGGQASNSAVTVDYATVGETALAGSDFLAKAGTLVFAPGESVKTIVIDIVDDTAVETVERFNLILANAVNATISDGNGVAEITANDAAVVAQPVITVGNRTVSEDDGYVDVAISLSAPGQSNVSVGYATASVTAGSSDFVALSGTMNFAPGETSKVVRIEITPDTGVESTETFRLNLSSPVNATLDATFATISLVDADAAGISVLSYGRGNDTYTVTNSGDVIVEEVGGGIDSVRSGVNYTLGSNVEYLTLTGFDATTATGNALNNILIGNAAPNVFNGGLGDDIIFGGAGIDTALYAAARSAYTISRSPGGATVAGPEGVDSLVGVERLQFTDAVVSVALGRDDFNLDGMGDVLWRNGVTGANFVWRSANAADGSAITAVGDTAHWRVTGVADFNGDGVSDVLWRNVLTGAGVIWRAGDSANTQGVATVPDAQWKVVGVADFNGDGKADLLWRNAYLGAGQIWYGADAGSAVAISAVPDASWRVAGVGDFTGDGSADVLWRNETTGTNVYWNAGDATQPTAIAPISSTDWRVVGVSDFNGDQIDDILWRNVVTGQNVIWRNGDATLAQGVAPVADANWSVVGTRDYNGNGLSDILWRNAGVGTNVIWIDGNAGNTVAMNPADGSWSIPVQTGSWSPTVPTSKYDLNGDGRSDLVWRNASTGVNSVWKSADAASQQSVAAVGDTAYKVAAVADFDGDGRADLLWRSSTTGANVIWKAGDAGATLAVPAVPNSWKVAGVGDIDSDGRADIVWRNIETGQNAIWRSGDPTTALPIAEVNDTSWKIAGVGDFDGDGRSDILWRNATSGGDQIWRAGNASNTLAVDAVADLSWRVAGTGDFNGDGRDDILWRNNTSGVNVVWDSASNANSHAFATVADSNWVIAGTGDYNGDGRADVLWRNAAFGQGVYWSGGNSAEAVSVVGVADPQWNNPGQTGTWLDANGNYGP